MKYFIAVLASCMLWCGPGWTATYEYLGGQYQSTFFNDSNDDLPAAEWFREPLSMTLTLDRALPGGLTDFALDDAAFEGDYQGMITIDGYQFNIATYLDFTAFEFTTAAGGEIIGWEVGIYGFLLGDDADKSIIRSSSAQGDTVFFDTEYNQFSSRTDTLTQSASTPAIGKWTLVAVGNEPPTVPLPGSWYFLLAPIALLWRISQR